MKSSPKRILYIGGFELPDKNAAAHRVIANGYALKDAGFEVVFLGLDKMQKKNSSIIGTEFKYDTFSCFKIRRPEGLIEKVVHLCTIRNIVEFIDQFEFKFDVIIAYNYPAIALNTLYKYCKKNIILLVSDCTEWYSSGYGNPLFKLIKWSDTYYRMIVVHKKIVNIICISRYLESYYKRKGCNTIYIPPLTNPKEEKWNNERSYFPNKERIFFYAGSPGKSGEKDDIGIIVKVFHEIYQKNKNFKLVFAGFRKKDFIQYFPHYLNDIEELANHISFLGRIDHKKVIRQLQQADYSIFFRPENKVTLAGFPTKLVESITAGTPVITNRSSNIADYITSGKNGFIIQNNSDENLKSCISEALQIPDAQLKDMHVHCIQSNYFDYEYHISSIKKYFNDHINKSINV